MCLEGRGSCTARSKLNKFEHVQGSLFLYGEVQCIMGNGHMGNDPSPSEQTDLRTHMIENITFLQLRCRAAKIAFQNQSDIT